MSSGNGDGNRDRGRGIAEAVDAEGLRRRRDNVGVGPAGAVVVRNGIRSTRSTVVDGVRAHHFRRVYRIGGPFLVILYVAGTKAGALVQLILRFIATDSTSIPTRQQVSHVDPAGGARRRTRRDSLVRDECK